MSNIFYNNRYLILRRILQVSIMLLFIGGHYWGWTVLKGNLSGAKVLNTFFLADPYMVLQTFATGYVLGIDVLVGALTISLFYTIIGGRSFCSWVCPVNIITDSANRLRKILKLHKEDIKVPLKRNVRYWISALGLAMSAILGVSAFELISPIGILQRGIIFSSGVGIATTFLIFFFDLFVLQNGWCGYLCPLGGFYSLINKVSLLKVKYNHDKCTACNACLIVCPEKQVLGIINKKSGQIKGSECTNCARCIDVCHDDALKFSVIQFKKSEN